MHATRTVCIDFDGTIVTQVEMNKEIIPDYVGDLKPGAAEIIRKLKKNGITIIIMSGRVHPHWHRVDEQTKLIESFLKENNIPFDGLISKHPTAAIFIDDKSLFDEDWDIIECEIERRLKINLHAFNRR